MQDVSVDRPDATDSTHTCYNLGFLVFFYERIFFKTKRWEISAPAILGLGNLEAYCKDTSGIFRPLYRVPFSSISVGGSVMFSPIRWISVGTGVGYRWKFRGEPENKSAFNTPY